MIRTLLAIGCWLGLATSTSQAADVVVGGRTFHVPQGFTVEQVAGPPLADRPIVADFDELGRLYVADSSGSNENVKKQLVDRPHRIVRLEDTDGDGHFDRSVVFADRMMFPEGAMWLDGSLYVSAPPSIWKLTDIDGDGRADRREEWFRGKTLTGCANDLHGPYAGLDGRIYWCKGAFGPQTYDRTGRRPLETRAAHIFRAKLDGTGIEPVMTGGMDNPVEVAFTPEGERIFTTTFLQHPAGGKRDGLIHALYGGVYGKIHDVIEGHPRTSPDVLPTLVHLGPAAPSGLLRAESDALGSRNHLFAACFNLRKVTRHKLSPEGASFSATSEDFLRSDDLDFHPTDVLEDADGSLLVIDTGGWYKICCPTSQLVKPDVLGAIYRVRRSDSLKVEDPRGLKLDWTSVGSDELVDRLADPRPSVRNRAIQSLGKLGDDGLPSLELALGKGFPTDVRRQAIWAACRVDSSDARSVIRIGLSDPEPSVRQSAAQAAGLWHDRSSIGLLVRLLNDSDLAVARASAEALSRFPGLTMPTAELLRAADTPDIALRHSATFALIESANVRGIRQGLASPSPLTRRAALMALEQMEGGRIASKPVFEAMGSSSTELRQAAWWVAVRHPEWNDALTAFLRARLESDSPANPINLLELESRLVSVCPMAGVQALIATKLVDANIALERKSLLLRVMARSDLKTAPFAWTEALARILRDGTAELLPLTVSTARALRHSEGSSGVLNSALQEVASRPSLPDEIRLEALSARSSGLDPVEGRTFTLLLEGLRPDRPTSDRTRSADVLARAQLSKSQRIALAGSLSTAGPMEINRLVDVFDHEEEAEVGLTLVESLKRAASLASLRIEVLKPKLSRFGLVLDVASQELYEAIDRETLGSRSRLESLMANLSSGDVRRGQLVFNGPKASCVTCHAIGYVGGKLGPDLSKVGEIRSERDILESIVFPSASFVRSFEPVSVSTKEGQVFSGLVRKQTNEEVIVALSADREERIARERIEAITPGTLSVMPAGLDQQLTPGELADLIAFLRACR